MLSRSSRGRPENVLRTSWGPPKSTSQGRPLDVRSRRPLDVISRHPRNGQIGSLGNVLGTLEGERPQDVLGTNICRLGLPYLEIIEVVLAHCNIVNNNYQHDSKILYTFISNNSFGQLLDILPKNCIF